MGHCYHHALSSARKWGGVAEDYLPLHQWFDVIWTSKPFLLFSPTEVVVPVLHRRGPAARVARINAQAERAAGRCLWTHRGERRSTRAVFVHVLIASPRSLSNSSIRRAMPQWRSTSRGHARSLASSASVNSRSRRSRSRGA